MQRVLLGSRPGPPGAALKPLPPALVTQPLHPGGEHPSAAHTSRPSDQHLQTTGGFRKVPPCLHPLLSAGFSLLPLSHSISHSPHSSRCHLYHVSSTLFILIFSPLTVSFPALLSSQVSSFPFSCLFPSLLFDLTSSSLLSLSIRISVSLLFSPLSLSGLFCSWSRWGALSPPFLPSQAPGACPPLQTVRGTDGWSTSSLGIPRPTGPTSSLALSGCQACASPTGCTVPTGTSLPTTGRERLFPPNPKTLSLPCVPGCRGQPASALMHLL